MNNGKLWVYSSRSDLVFVRDLINELIRKNINLKLFIASHKSKNGLSLDELKRQKIAITKHTL